MKIIKTIFLLSAFLFLAYITAAFWTSPSYKAQIQSVRIPCGIIIHFFLVGVVILLYLQITEGFRKVKPHQH